MACNNSARRQWRKQEAVVGAAASKMRVQVHEADAGSRNPYSLARESFPPPAHYCFAKIFTSSLSMKAAPAKPEASSWPSCLPSFLA